AALGVPSSEIEVMATAPLTRLQIRAETYSVEKSNPKRATIYYNEASTGAFSLLGLKLLFGEVYGLHSDNQLILSRTAAALISTNIEDLVGSRVTRVDPFDSSNDMNYVVVGIVDDVHYDSVSKSPEPVTFIPTHLSAGWT